MKFPTQKIECKGNTCHLTYSKEEDICEYCGLPESEHEFTHEFLEKMKGISKEDSIRVDINNYLDVSK